VTGLACALGLFHGYLNGSAMAEAKLGLLGLAGIVAALFKENPMARKERPPLESGLLKKTCSH
jgi:hypothetical protein